MARETFAVAPEGGKRVEFDFAFWTDSNNSTVYTFGAIPVIDPVQIARINRLAAIKGGDGALDLIEAVQSAVRRMLDDADGTPADWFPAAAPQEPPQPDALAYPVGDSPTSWDGYTETGISGQLAVTEQPVAAYATQELLDDEPEARFIAPDGSLRPYGESVKFTEFEAGSSLRRWKMLMNDSNDLLVPVEQLLQVWRWLTAKAGKGRTGR
jgi:hypothetical protein